MAKQLPSLAHYEALNLIPSIIIVLNDGNEIKFINSFGEKFFGISFLDVDGYLFSEKFSGIQKHIDHFKLHKTNEAEERVDVWSINKKAYLIRYSFRVEKTDIIICGNAVTEHNNTVDGVDMFRDFFEHSPDIMMIINENQQVVECNKATTDKFGLDRPAVVGAKLHQLFKANAKELNQCFENFLQYGYCENNEIMIESKRGTLWFSVSGTAIRNAQGENIYGRLIWRDITELKENEQSHNRIRKRYRNFIENSTEGIWRVEFPGLLDTKKPLQALVDEILNEGFIAECNHRLAEIYGFEKVGDMYGLKIIEILQPEGHEELSVLKDLLTRFIRRGWVAKNVIAKAKNIIGKSIYISTSTNAAIDSKGMIKELWGVQQDVTQEVQTNKQLKQSFLELRFIDNINMHSIRGASIRDMSILIAETYSKQVSYLSGIFFFTCNEETGEPTLLYKNITDNSLGEFTPPIKKGEALYHFLKNEENIIVSRISKNGEFVYNAKDEKLNDYFKWAKKRQKSLNVKTLATIPLVSKEVVLGLTLVTFEKLLSDKELDGINRVANGIKTAMIKSYAEAKILKQQKFNETILNNMPADIAVFDKENRYRYINPAGIADDDLRNWLIGKTDYDYCQKKQISSSVAVRREAAFNLVKESKRGHSWVDIHSDPTKGEKQMLRVLKPYYENDQLKYMIGYGTDITRQKKQEELLLTLTDIQKQFITSGDKVDIFDELLTIFSNLTKSDSGFIATKNPIDKKTGYLINASTDNFWEQNLQTICKTFEGESSSGIRVKWYGNQTKSNYLIHALNKIDKNFEITHLPKDFSDNYVFLGIGFYSKNGLRAVVGLIKHNGFYGKVDIDAIDPFATTCATLFEAYYDKLKANEVSRLNRRLADIVANSTDCIISAGLDEIITSWNKGAEELFGYVANDAIGKRIGLLVPKDRAKESKQLRTQIKEGRHITNFETIRIHKNGKRIEVESSFFPLRNEHNVIIGMSAIIRDNSEKVKLDQMKLLSILEGEEKERNRIAHDLHDGLGQILSGLILNLQAVKLNVDSDIDNLIAIARLASEEYRAITQNLISPSLKGVGLVGAISNVCDNLNQGDHQVHFTHAPINKLEQPIEALLYRCAQELINNAIKHSKAETIDVDLRQKADKIYLTVKDNGLGFEYAEKRDGLGIGLYSMKSRVQMYRGTFNLHSEKNSGTMAEITVNNFY